MVVMRMRAVVALSAFVFLAGIGPAEAGGGGFGSCAGFSRGRAIVMRDACFEGTAHITETGSTVTVTNDGNLAHNITAVDGSFASGLLQPGESFTFRVGAPGAVPFYCTLHGSATGSGMAGVLVVEAAGARATAARVSAPTEAIPRETAHNSVPSYLAAGALLLSTIALAVVIALPRPRRRAPVASS
jgi:plastocyanin